MSNAGIPLRVIQEISGHRTLDELQKYLEVSEAQVRGAVSSLSMISHLGAPALNEPFSLLTEQPVEIEDSK